MEARSPNQKFTGREGAAEGGTMRYPGARPPGYEIPPLRGWQKPLQDPTPVRGAELLPNGGRFEPCLTLARRPHQLLVNKGVWVTT